MSSEPQAAEAFRRVMTQLTTEQQMQPPADLIFANSLKKAALISQLLDDLGARDVRVESTVGFIPQTNMVHFTPTPLIAEWLGQTW
jgi:hypothetical protein